MFDRPTPDPGRDHPEVEITSEMIAAGVSALSRYDSEFESREEGVARIFQAMHRVLKNTRAD
jgi:hypothetical protein